MKKENILEKIKENSIEKAYVIATFYNKVCLGYYDGKDIIFNSGVNFNLCTEVRIFNKDLELRINTCDNQIYYKVIKDTDYTDRLKDEYMFISGNKIVASNQNFTTIKYLGGNIDIPIKLTEEEVKNGIRLVVRNYLSVDDLKQVNISESRLVDICLEEEV